MARTDPRPHYGTKRRIRKDGYIDIYDPTHPLARKDGYLMEHRMIAWDAGILTDRSLHVHHRNGNKTDNRPENLEAVDPSTHQREHHVGLVAKNQYGTFPVRRGQEWLDHSRALARKYARQARERAKRES